MNHRVDTIPDLDGSIAKRNETVGCFETILKVVMKGDGVEHPGLTSDCHSATSLAARWAAIFAVRGSRSADA